MIIHIFIKTNYYIIGEVYSDQNAGTSLNGETKERSPLSLLIEEPIWNGSHKQTSYMVDIYNQYMSGVDKADQLILYYGFPHHSDFPSHARYVNCKCQHIVTQTTKST